MGESTYNKEIYKQLFNSIKTQIWYLKDPFTYGAVNKAHADFLGKNVSEIEDKNISEFLEEVEVKVCLISNYEVLKKRKKERKALVASRKRYRSIFKYAPNAVFTIDDEGNYKDINLEGLNLTGYTKEELLKLNISDLIAKSN